MKPRIFCLTRKPRIAARAVEVSTAKVKQVGGQAPLLSIEEVKQAFIARGDSVAGWAREHGYKRHTVADVLSGRQIGRRGEAHKVAVALRLKPDPLKKAA